MSRSAKRGPLALAIVVVIILAVTGLEGCADPDDRAGKEGTAGRDTAASSTSVGATSLPEVEGPRAEGRTPWPEFGEVEIRIVEGPDGEPVVLCVLVAETPAQRQRGLMGVTDETLGGYDGMLFVFEDDVEGGFWMKDTLIPLSIAYFDRGGAVVGTSDMTPCPDAGDACPSYEAPGPYRRALEVPRGALEDLDLEPGGPTRMSITGGCEPART